MPLILPPEIEDLCNIPYRFGGRDRAQGIDCLYACRLALERIYPDFDALELPSNPDEEAATLERLRAGEHRWRFLGPSVQFARCVGDLIHGTSPTGGACLAVIVSEAGPTAFTAFPEIGSTKVRAGRLRSVKAVFRRRSA